jgi:hypothetical protein
MSISSNQGERCYTLAINAATGTTANPTYAGGTPEVIPEMTVPIVATGVANVSIQFDGSFELQNGDAFDVSIYRDDVAVRTRRFAYTSSQGIADPAASIVFPARIHVFVLAESAGVHVYDARWSVASGTARAYGAQRDLAVVEVPATVTA